jgi:hypothetical protein
MKADLEEDANMKYLQIFQYISNRETIASLDFESIKKVNGSLTNQLIECFYVQLAKKNPVVKSITSAMMVQTTNIVFHEFVRQVQEVQPSKDESVSIMSDEGRTGPQVPFREYGRITKNSRVALRFIA